MVMQITRVPIVARLAHTFQSFLGRWQGGSQGSCWFLKICLAVVTCILCAFLVEYKNFSLENVFLVCAFLASPFLVYPICELCLGKRLVKCQKFNVTNNGDQTQALLKKVTFAVFTPLVFLYSPSEAQVYTLQKVEVEEIAGKYYKLGTMNEITKLVLEKNKKSNEKIRLEIRLAHRKILSNVENYLDWYYSLTSEYLRAAKLLGGMKGYEEYLEGKLEEYLLEGDPFSGLENKLQQIINQNIEDSWEYKAILSENLVLAGNSHTQRNKFVPVRKWSKDINDDIMREIFLAKNIANRIRSLLFITRKGGTAATGAIGSVGGAVTGSIVAKVGASGIFKTAAVPIVKLVGTKVVGGAVGGTGGAAAGAAIGSIIPGVGTAIGAVIGGAIGIVGGGIVIDKVITEVGEVINRDDFRDKIVKVIQKHERDLVIPLQ